MGYEDYYTNSDAEDVDQIYKLASLLALCKNKNVSMSHMLLEIRDNPDFAKTCMTYLDMDTVMDVARLIVFVEPTSAKSKIL